MYQICSCFVIEQKTNLNKIKYNKSWQPTHNTFNYTNTTRAQLLMRSYPSDLCYFEELFFSILVIDPSSLPHLLLLDIASLSEQPTRTLPACTLHSNFYSLLLIVFDVVVSPSRDHTSGKNGWWIIVVDEFVGSETPMINVRFRFSVVTVVCRNEMNDDE